MITDETLNLLSQTLELACNLVDASISGSGSRSSHLSSSIAQVIHDYGWDLSDCCNDSDLLGTVRSNLVVLFSPVCRSNKDLIDFMGVDDVVNDCDVFCDKFRGVFGHVRDAFASRDIHFSWVDLNFDNDGGNDVKKDKLDEYSRLVGFFQNGVKSLGWGLCSSDSIVLGSALVSFGLIYPMIGVSATFPKLNDKCKKVCGQLNLEILDVSGKPMECKYCDLQLLDLKMLRGRRLHGLSISEGSEKAGELSQQSCGIWESFGDGVVKIDVKSLCRNGESVNMDEQISDVVLVDELSTDSKKKNEKSSTEFFADRERLLGIIAFVKCQGHHNQGVLKPFTINSAFLFILKDCTDLCGAQNGVSELNLGHGSSEKGEKTVGIDMSMDSVSGVCKSESRRKHRMHPHRYKDLSWGSFCKAAARPCEMELEGAYFSKECDTSKKLKFLQCWIKQAAKSSSSLPCKSDTPKIMEKTEERLCQLHQESQQPLPSLAKEHAVVGPQIKQTGASQEAAEAFFSNLSQRIQNGIASGVDLVAFAQRVVSSCIYWLRRKLEPNTKEESQASLEKSDGSSYGGLVAGELIKLLLINPKDIAGKHKDSDLSSKATDAHSSNTSSEDRIRQYELQILFRMEILQSEIVAGIRDSTKNKFVKQICCLLEFIQCNMEDGFFGDFDFSDYVGRTIKSRYSQNLGSIVHKIYDQMDLLLFDDGDDDESPNPLLNSEDSSQSWKVGSEPNSTDDSLHTGSTDHDRKLVEAQERRTRALKFASFSRRAMPDLQRVWAPKPPKLSRSKSDSFRRSKRKDRHRENYDRVCETPTSGAKKCLFPSDGSVGDVEEYREHGGNSTSSVHRALFQDESWHHEWGL
ncbi:uncharacterized protein LOC110729461 [Chenopodium quinoa]|uniref:uncharacterized protein LOC110729461 n=1 Tax=Chenopodium quinoa TaxID=63459 RepID=UPI000B77633C|nr:uncharacterized protein LOC110729461 [Chenopodium quinoa]